MLQIPVQPTVGIHTELEAVLNQFDPISLQEMDAVTLLNRVDIKYILTPEQLLHDLGRLVDEYSVLQVNERRMSRYYTLYFDTPNFWLYQQHHNGGQNRYKVRFRQYVDSDLAFLEVKRKDNKGLTLKKRLRVSTVTPELDYTMQAFLRTRLPVSAQVLETKLWNRFVRITLVSKHHIERLTLDFDLSFGNEHNATHFPSLVVAEVKQENRRRASAFAQQMRAHCTGQLSFSKYCIGAALHYPQLKQNNFKPVFLQMHKLGAIGVSGTI